MKSVNTKKYHVFAPMGRFQLESIYLYFPPPVENKGKLILNKKCCCFVHLDLAL